VDRGHAAVLASSTVDTKPNHHGTAVSE
jgi:hypothetical protein